MKKRERGEAAGSKPAKSGVCDLTVDGGHFVDGMPFLLNSFELSLI